LPVEKTRKLQDSGFDFQPRENIDDENWMEKFELLKAFKHKKGSFSVPLMHSELGKWTRSQRQRLKKEDGLGERMKERRALLIQIGFWNDLGSIECDDSDAGTEHLNVVDDANYPSNDSAEVAEKENEQLQHAQSLKRAGNTKVTERPDKQPRLRSASRAEVSVSKILPFPNHKSVREVPMDIPLHSKGPEIRRPSQETKKDMLPEPSEGKRGMISFHNSPCDNTVVYTYEDVKMAASLGKTMTVSRTKTFPTGNPLKVLPADNRAMKAKAAFATSSLRASGTGASAARPDKGATAKPVSHAPSGVAHGSDMTFCTSSTFAADALPLDHAVKCVPSQGGNTEFQLYLSCYLGLKDRQKALLNDCEALVDSEKALDSEQANLSMRIDPSVELVALESDQALTDTVASMKVQASAKVDHGHCPDQMKALMDQAFDQVKEVWALKIKLKNKVEQQEMALATQFQAFEAWKAELGRIDARLARINAIREQHMASLPEVLRTANERDS
jgi:hypothetical protein